MHRQSKVYKEMKDSVAWQAGQINVRLNERLDDIQVNKGINKRKG